MSRSISYINSNKKKINISLMKPYILTKFSEATNVNIYNSKGMLEDGATYIDNTMGTKDIDLEFVIRVNSDEEIIKLKRDINNIFNPKLGLGYLVYKDSIKEFKITCLIDSLPIFQKINETNYKCLISLNASNPFWENSIETKANIALWRGDFRFPLAIPTGGIIKGYREPNLIVNIANNGDLKTGMLIEFKALGTLTNPSLFNVNTREYIKINKEMQAGDIIRVNTNFNKKRIENIKNGITTNILNYIDLGGGDTFLQLDVGDNLFRYDADSNLNNLEVNIYFSEKYLGV